MYIQGLSFVIIHTLYVATMQVKCIQIQKQRMVGKGYKSLKTDNSLWVHDKIQERKCISYCFTGLSPQVVQNRNMQNREENIVIIFSSDIWLNENTIQYNWPQHGLPTLQIQGEGGLLIREYLKSSSLHTFTKKREPPQVSHPNRNTQ